MLDRSGWVVSISGETAGHPPLSAVPVRVPSPSPPHGFLPNSGQPCASPLGSGRGGKQREPPDPTSPRGASQAPLPAALPSLCSPALRTPTPKGGRLELWANQLPPGPGHQGPCWAVLGGASLQRGVSEELGEQPRGKPQGSVQEEGVSGQQGELCVSPAALSGPGWSLSEGHRQVSGPYHNVRSVSTGPSTGVCWGS